MNTQTVKTGRKGGAKRIADKMKKIRQSPIARSVFQIVNDHAEAELRKPARKIAQGED